LGSGYFGTPWERMHRAKASAWELAGGGLADPPASGEPEPADDGPLPLLHAATTRARPAVAMTAAA
jgi:hypothetical protein